MPPLAITNPPPKFRMSVTESPTAIAIPERIVKARIRVPPLGKEMFVIPLPTSNWLMMEPEGMVKVVVGEPIKVVPVL